MGDRWRPSLLGSSTYIWYPLSWDTGVPQIVHADVWSVNINAGTYTAAAGTSYEAESGTLSGTAVLGSGSSFSAGKYVGYLGHGGSVTLNNVQGIGGNQWVALYYANGKCRSHLAVSNRVLLNHAYCHPADSTWRNTTIRYVNKATSVMHSHTHLAWSSANGGPTILVDQPNTGSEQSIISVPVLLNLRSGANSITIGAGQSSKSSAPKCYSRPLTRAMCRLRCRFG